MAARPYQLGSRRREKRPHECCQNPGQDIAYDTVEELVHHSALLRCGVPKPWFPSSLVPAMPETNQGFRGDNCEGATQADNSVKGTNYLVNILKIILCLGILCQKRWKEILIPMLMGGVPHAHDPYARWEMDYALADADGFLLRRRVFLRLIAQAQKRSIQTRRLHRLLAGLFMMRARYRYARRVGVKDICGTSAWDRQSEWPQSVEEWLGPMGEKKESIGANGELI